MAYNPETPEYEYDGKRYQFQLDQNGERNGIYYDTQTGEWGNSFMEQLAAIQPHYDENYVKTILDEMKNSGEFPQYTSEVESDPRLRDFSGLAYEKMKAILDNTIQNSPLLAISDNLDLNFMFLKTCAEILGASDPEKLHFAIMTNNLNRWEDFSAGPSFTGLIPIYHESADQFISYLGSTYFARLPRQDMFYLFIDNLSDLDTSNSDTRLSLGTLAVDGGKRKLAIVSTALNQDFSTLGPWAQKFSKKSQNLLRL